MAKRTHYLVYVLLSLAVLGPLLLPGFVMTLDSPYALVQDPSPLFYGLNEHWISAGMPFFSLMHIIAKVVPVWLLEKLVLLTILFLAGLGAHRLFFWRGAGSYFAGILYMINPFTYLRFVTGQWQVLFAYALTPFAVKSFLELLEHPTLKKAIELAVLSTLVGIIVAQGFFLLFLALAAIFVSKGIKERGKITREGKIISISAVLFLFLNTYWLVPTLTKGSTILQEISEADMLLFAPKVTSSGRLMLDLASMHGFWRDAYIYISDLTPIWLLLFFFILYLASYGFICHYKDRERGWLIISIAGIGVTSFVLAVGAASSITMPIFQWLWEHIFFFRGFRDSQKFIGLVCLSYAFLGGLGVKEFAVALKQQERRWSKAALAILIVLSMVVPLVYSLPMFGSYGQLRAVYPPQDWAEVNEYLKSDPGDFNVLFLPWHLYMDFTWLPNRDKRLTSLGERFFSKPIIQGDNIEMPGVYSTSTNPVSKYVEFLLRNGGSVNNLGELLVPLNVKYVILVHEADYQNYDFLYRQEDLKVEQEKPGITLFQNQRATARSYAVDSVVNIGTVDDYQRLSQVQDVMQHVYVIGGEQGVGNASRTEELEVIQRSPVKYQIGSTSQKYIVFTVPQDVNTEYWQYNGQEPIMRNLGFMPVFESSGEGEIVYTRFYRIYLPAYTISALALLVMGSLLSFDTLKRRRGKKQNNRE